MANAEPRARSRYRSPSSSAFDQYLLDIRKLPMILDPAEERKLAERARRGDRRAAERLVTANLRFVISYVKRFQGHGLDLSELVAIGNEGLLKAVAKFDPKHGVKFISYAVWWIRQCVLKALAEQTRTVRIPLNQNTALIRMARIESYLSQELGRTLTGAEPAPAGGGAPAPPPRREIRACRAALRRPLAAEGGPACSNVSTRRRGGRGSTCRR